MKHFGFLWIFISILSVVLGVLLISISTVNFILEPFLVFKTVLGVIWVLCGVVMFFVSIKLFAMMRIEKKLNDIKE